MPPQQRAEPRVVIIGGGVGLGYVPCEGESETKLLSSQYAIEVAISYVPAEASIQPLFDPKASRMPC